MVHLMVTEQLAQAAATMVKAVLFVWAMVSMVVTEPLAQAAATMAKAMLFV